MTTSDRAASTAARMRDAAAELEVAEAVLHRSAEASPDEHTRDRLHRLGDQVTAKSRDIAARAEGLSDDLG
jgi:hypothetical protein